MAELMTIEEVERYLRFTRKTIYRLVKQGDIPAVKIGNKWRFDKELIDKWLRQSKENTKARILVIDDDELIRALFKEVLEGEGHIVVTADTGEKGLAYIMQQNFNLVFLDLKLPGIDGAEILSQMRSTGRHVPVVIITGYPDSEIMERAARQGLLGIMLKPFNASGIIGTINSFLHATNLITQ
ncbi:response regulator [Chloroflexota bacterium]